MAAAEDNKDILARAAQAFQGGDYAGAVDLLAPAASAHPDDADLASALAYALSRAGSLAQAAEQFDRAVALRPKDAGLLRDAGAVHLRNGNLDTALERYRAAYRLSNNDISLLGNIVDVLLRLERGNDALTLVDGTLALAPRAAALHYVRGVVLGALGRQQDERQAYENAIKLDPRLVDAHTNLGVLARDQHRFDDALRHFKHALAIDPEHPGARTNRAQTNLLLGQFTHGWRDYEWRWRDGGQTMPYAGSPWLGEGKLAGQTLLVHAEQGLGDTIQFSRYVRALVPMAGAVILRVQASLAPLLRTSLPGVTVIGDDVPVPAFDRHVPLLSLPLALSRQGAEPWPLGQPLRADEALAREWAALLPARGSATRPRIGLAWSGNAGHPDDRNRSIPFAELAPLLDAPCDFVCVQKDIRPADLAAIEQWRTVAGHDNLHLPNDALRDFSETAALMANLDSVITVDTATVHLAGALGIPTILLLPAMPDWRWQLNREDTPWYPSVSLRRKTAGSDWIEVLQELRDKLKAGR
ncbi:tetratricopeptide repeat protein [Achromobacter aloeverae]|uniref:Glycosyltransferase n=1 Tax=Achromobacter aloeverae TaxID=1750518 RepID=A0A4Q1HE17_9BURK|nr:tetratricopeptide repeat protein [Achromobacter aloeverae]RXN84475.1 glycosyltransferase [Achromobacter aloeverae]